MQTQQTKLPHGPIRAPVFSADLIEEMVDAMCGANAPEEEKDIYREALQGLVRLAQAEQLLSMQLDFNAATTGNRLAF